ncbi:MAG TPA: hypothetical protein VF832_06710 [Longimicrobiales bacterium]
MNARGALSPKAFLLVLLAGACSRSPADEAEKQVATLHSWTAAAGMAVEAWAAGRVTTPYTTRTLEVGAAEVRQAARSLEEKLPALTGEPAAAAAEGAVCARQAASHLAAARVSVARGDRANAIAAAHMLAVDAGVLSASDGVLRGKSR